MVLSQCQHSDAAAQSGFLAWAGAAGRGRPGAHACTSVRLAPRNARACPNTRPQVGHNISGFDLGVLLKRMEFHKVGFVLAPPLPLPHLCLQCY